MLKCCSLLYILNTFQIDSNSTLFSTSTYSTYIQYLLNFLLLNTPANFKICISDIKGNNQNVNCLNKQGHILPPIIQPYNESTLRVSKQIVQKSFWTKCDFEDSQLQSTYNASGGKSSFVLINLCDR